MLMELRVRRDIRRVEYEDRFMIELQEGDGSSEEEVEDGGMVEGGEGGGG